jgi:signal transduction histidine kinase
LLLACAASLLLVAAQTWWTIAADRELTLTAERATAQLAVGLLEQQASEHLAVAARQLDAIAIAAAASSGSPREVAATIRAAIRGALENSRAAGAYQYVNVAGERWASVTDFPSFVFAAEPRPYIDFLLGHPGYRSIMLNRPLQRFIDARWVMPMARNLYDQDGRHVGLVSTEVDIADFAQLYTRVAADAQASVALLTNSGAVIARAPPAPRLTGDDALAQPPPGSAAWQGEAGEYLHAYQRLAQFPATVVLSRARAKVLAPWLARARERVLYALGSAALVALLAYALSVYIGRLRRSEASLRESERRYHQLFDRSPVPLALVRGYAMRPTYVNDAFLRQFRYRDGDGGAPHLGRLWADRAAQRIFLTAMRADGQVDGFEAALRCADGQVLSCMVSARVVEDLSEPMAIFSPIDMSAQHQAERAMRELNTELEQRVRQRTETLERQHDELQQAKELAEQAGRAKARVLAAASHDLRQPLHALSLYSGVLVSNPSGPTLTEVAGHIDASVRALGDLLNAMLDLSKLDAGVFRVEPCVFSLSDMLARIAHDYRVPAHQKGLALRLEVDALLVCSDPMMVERIARNLIDNAVKYSAAGTVTIRARRDGALVRASVSDTGPGIALAEQERVFDEFYQIDNPGRGDDHGLGLGLSIVARLAALLEADLTLDSAPGAGSSFGWHMPYYRVHEASSSDAPADDDAPRGAPALRGLRVLVLDDEASIRHSMVLLLRSWACQAHGVADLAEAQAQLVADAGQCDLLMVDMRLQGGADGLRVAHTLRARWGDIPVLLISGETNPLALGEAAASAFPLLYKPVGTDALRRQVELLCARGPEPAEGDPDEWVNPA